MAADNRRSPGDPFPGRRGFWRPLPVCPGCDQPVRRATADANGGLCTDCRALYEAGDVAPDPDRVDLAQWQLLAAQRGRAEREQQQRRRTRRARL
jgi:hypothetical protein